MRSRALGTTLALLLLIAPAAQPARAVGIREGRGAPPRGSGHTAAKPQANPVARYGPSQEGEVAGEWKLKASHCFGKLENKRGLIFQCYLLYEHGDDGSGKWDYYALDQYAYAESKNGWTLRKAKIYADKTNKGDPMYFVKVAPGSDLKRDPCESVTIGASVGAGVGGSVSHTAELCDKWDVTFDRDWPGYMVNTWVGKAKGENRDVADIQIIKVKQGDWPTWYLTVDFCAKKLFTYHCTSP